VCGVCDEEGEHRGIEVRGWRQHLEPLHCEKLNFRGCQSFFAAVWGCSLVKQVYEE